MQAVDHFIAKHELVSAGATIVIGVSGGPDSMALLHYFQEKRAAWNLRLIAAHINHRLRGNEADEDYRYVESYCQQNDILFAGTAIDVDAYKRAHHLSMQVAARECRYRFFTEVMNQHQADCLALAHHGDDQIETMMMRQVRGTYGRGFSGIPVKRDFACGVLIRPFLCLSKSDIEQYLKSVGLTARKDTSNESDDYTRNRFRRTVLPFLKAENPKVHIHFQQQSEALAADDAFLSSLAKEKVHTVVKEQTDEKIIAHKAKLLALPIALQRRVVHLILNCLYCHFPAALSVVHIDQILQLCQASYPSGELHLPGRLRVIRSYEQVVFSRQKEHKPDSFCHLLSVPSTVQLSNGRIQAEFTKALSEFVDESSHFFADADAVAYPLTVRSRKPGDRMVPKGMNGTKKIKDIFIDEKIDRKMRSQIPVIEDAKGRILWLVGVKKSAVASFSEDTTTFLHLSYQK